MPLPFAHYMQWEGNVLLDSLMHMPPVSCGVTCKVDNYNNHGSFGEHVLGKSEVLVLILSQRHQQLALSVVTGDNPTQHRTTSNENFWGGCMHMFLTQSTVELNLKAH